MKILNDKSKMKGEVNKGLKSTMKYGLIKKIGWKKPALIEEEGEHKEMGLKKEVPEPKIKLDKRFQRKKEKRYSLKAKSKNNPRNIMRQEREPIAQIEKGKTDSLKIVPINQLLSKKPDTIEQINVQSNLFVEEYNLFKNYKNGVFKQKDNSISLKLIRFTNEFQKHIICDCVLLNSSSSLKLKNHSKLIRHLYSSH